MVITTESSNEFPYEWISIWRLVKPHANYCVDILTARWLRPAFAESYRLRRVTLSKELVAVHVWNAPDQWHNWRTAPALALAKIIVKTGPLRSLYFGIYYSFGFRRLLFFLRFSECFPVISGFCIAVQYRVCYCFSTIFWVLASGLPSAKFTMAQTSSYVTAPDQSKVALQIRAMYRPSSSILQ